MGVSAVVGIAAVIGAGASVASSRQQKKANRAAQRSENIRNQRERIQARRAARIQSAQAQAASVNSGAGPGSSAIQGSVASLQSQTNANVSFAKQIGQLNNQRLNALSKAQDFQTVGAVANQVGSFAGGF